MHRDDHITGIGAGDCRFHLPATCQLGPKALAQSLLDPIESLVQNPLGIDQRTHRPPTHCGAARPVKSRVRR